MNTKKLLSDLKFVQTKLDEKDFDNAYEFLVQIIEEVEIISKRKAEKC